MNRADDGTSTVDPVKARHALVIAISMILEADPAVKSITDMRNAGDAVGRDVRLQIRALCDEHDRTGRHAWDAVPVAIQ